MAQDNDPVPPTVGALVNRVLQDLEPYVLPDSKPKRVRPKSTQTKAYDKSERDRLFAFYKKDLAHVKVLEVTGTSAIIRYAGVPEKVEWKEGLVLHVRGHDAESLAPTDIMFLCAFGGDLMAAVAAGYTTKDPPAQLQLPGIPRKRWKEVSIPAVEIDTPQVRTHTALTLARLTRLYEVYESGRRYEYLMPLRTTHDEVIIRFAGTSERLFLEEGRVRYEPRQDGRWLSRDNYAFLCRLAKDILVAVHNGYSNVKKGKEKRRMERAMGISSIEPGVSKKPVQLRLF